MSIAVFAPAQVPKTEKENRLSNRLMVTLYKLHNPLGASPRPAVHRLSATLPEVDLQTSGIPPHLSSRPSTSNFFRWSGRWKFEKLKNLLTLNMILKGWSKHGLLLPALCAGSLARYQTRISSEVEAQLPLSSGENTDRVLKSIHHSYVIVGYYFEIVRFKIWLHNCTLWFIRSLKICLCYIFLFVAEFVAKRCKVGLPNKLYIYSGYWHGAQSCNGPSTWRVLSHSRGAFSSTLLWSLLTDCHCYHYSQKWMYNVYFNPGEGMWNVCLCGAHLWDCPWLPQVKYF